MHPTSAIGPPGELAVTYRCTKGHRDVRFYRNGPVPRNGVCSICGEVAMIHPSEYQRHKDLMTPLAEWLAQ